MTSERTRGDYFLLSHLIPVVRAVTPPNNDGTGVIMIPIVGIGSFLLIRRVDITSKAIIGMLARSLSGILVGLIGGLVMWIIVGHIVIGF